MLLSPAQPLHPLSIQRLLSRLPCRGISDRAILYKKSAAPSKFAFQTYYLTAEIRSRPFSFHKLTASRLTASHSSSFFFSTPARMGGDIESAKRTAATRAVAENFHPSFKYIGIGSGTTIVYVVEAIKAFGANISGMRFIPTGYQSRQLIVNAGLTPWAFDDLPEDTLMDICFDGADEVDEDLNCIKGGGACLHQEKLVATHAKRFVCVADYRKLQTRLLSTWPSIPIEVEPLAVTVVLDQLVHELGSAKPEIRQLGSGKVSPLKTDQNNFIVDAPFPTLLLPRDVEDGIVMDKKKGIWEVQALAREIKHIEGVLSVGIFSGENGDEARARGSRMGGQKPSAVYFGMQDGSVEVKTAAAASVGASGSAITQ